MSSYFKEVLLRHGVLLPQESPPSKTLYGDNGGLDADPFTISGSAMITCASDPNRAMRKVESSLRMEEHKLKDYMRGLQEFLSDDGFLATSLLPIRIVDEDGTATNSQTATSFFGQADTFLKLSLLNPALQGELITFLVEKMVLLVQVEEEGDHSVGNASVVPTFDSSHPAIKVLNHLRWCDVIYNPRLLVESLMDAVTIFPRPIQIEIISSLPGLAADKDQHELLEKLQVSLYSPLSPLPSLLFPTFVCKLHPK